MPPPKLYVPLLVRRTDRCAQLELLAARDAWGMASGTIFGVDPAGSRGSGHGHWWATNDA